MPGDDDYIYHCIPWESSIAGLGGYSTTRFDSGVVQMTLRYIQGSDIFIGFVSSSNNNIGITLPSCSIFYRNQYTYPFGRRYSAPSGTIVNIRMNLDAGVILTSLNGQLPVSVPYDTGYVSVPIHVFFDACGPESSFQLLSDP